MPIGVPSVAPSKMPDQISGTSASLRCVVIFDCPGRRRSRSGCKSAAVRLMAAWSLAQNRPNYPPRFGVAAETEIFGQDSPKQLLASIDKAFARKRIDYVLAHLLEPSYGDAKLAQYYREKFGRLPDDD